MRDQRIPGEWINTNGWSIWFYPDGTGTSKAEKTIAQVQFQWKTQEEKILVSGVEGSGLPWPPKADSYEFSYRSSDVIPGSAYLTITKSVSHNTGDPPPTEQPGMWVFERR